MGQNDRQHQCARAFAETLDTLRRQPEPWPSLRDVLKKGLLTSGETGKRTKLDATTRPYVRWLYVTNFRLTHSNLPRLGPMGARWEGRHGERSRSGTER